MATGTLFKATFSRARLPPVAGVLPLDAQALTIPTGVLVKELSMSVTEPISSLLVPPAERSIPTPQLLMERPEYVQPQSQSWMIAK
jgi:hypothetical protein